MDDFRRGVYMQTLLRDPAAGVMHSMIYFGFLVLAAVTATLEVNHQLPEDAKFLARTDLPGLRRPSATPPASCSSRGGVGDRPAIRGPPVPHPQQVQARARVDPRDVLRDRRDRVRCGGLPHRARRPAGVRGVVVRRVPARRRWSTASVGSRAGTGRWWIAHVAAFVVFLVILPTTMLRHMFTSPMNMYLRDRERPKGAMKPLPNLMETELESFGASTVEDFTWKQLLDTDACTMCGRCTSVCPAHATGKPLDPREIVLKVGEVMAATGEPKVRPPIGVDPDITIEADDVFQRIDAEEIWACVSCRACDEVCPVNIEILDKILDMRRYLSLMESNFPTELGASLPVDGELVQPVGHGPGRAGRLGRRARRGRADRRRLVTHRPRVPLLGGLRGVLRRQEQEGHPGRGQAARAGPASTSPSSGPSELCTGDPARRSGNEYIFQMLATQNVETLNGMDVRKIVTQCPHCFNTLANEYPQLGGEYQVIHHSQLLESLIADGRLDLSGARLEERLVYHDSCYLGRHNDVYMSPRRVVGSLGGLEVVEAPRNGNKGMCCGAGGARMWMEEHVGTHINEARSRELLDTGATRIATACPFCYIMIDDGVKAQGVDEDQVRVGDIALHLAEALDATGPAEAPSAPG